MAQINDNDDSDLLILSDEDTNNDTLVMEVNDDVLDNSSKNELISFDNGVIENKDENSFDFSGFDLDNKPIEINEQWNVDSLKVEENSFDDNLSSSINITDNNKQSMWIVNDNWTSTTTLNSNIWTMIEILDKAILESASRSNIIEGEIESEQNNISHLKEQMAILEWKVKVSENLVSELNTEKTMISKNIKLLEKMKVADNSTVVAK